VSDAQPAIPGIPPEILALIDAAVDAVAVVDTEQRLVHHNRAFAQLVGLHQRELRKGPAGLCHTALRLATCAEPDGCLSKRALRANRPVRLDEVKSTGDDRVFILSALPLSGAGGAPYAVVETYRDVSAESRIQTHYKELLEAEQARSARLRIELDEARAALLQVFRDESAGICQRLTEDFVALETAPAPERPTLLGRILRDLHTLKGSAGNVGLPDASSLAHAMESLLEDVQSGKREVQPRMVDLLLGGTEAIASQADAASRGELELDALRNAKSRVELLLAGQDPGGTPRGPRPRRAGDPLEPMIRVPTSAAIGAARGLSKFLDAIDLGIEASMLKELLEDTRKHTRVLMTASASSLFEAFRRPVREQAAKRGVDVSIEIAGGDVRIDRRLLDALRAPLGHLLRNAVDHGLEARPERLAAGKPEAATITLTAAEEADRIEVSVADDGRGIDPAKVRESAAGKGIAEAASMDDARALELIWRPGFTTARTITETSGRGVGLDAVKAQILSAGGDVRVESTVGKGTKFVLHLPKDG
jgi:signal transduction histidine kinase